MGNKDTHTPVGMYPGASALHETPKPMIFAAFGNSPKPFTRLARALDKLASELDEEIFVQTGHTQYEYTKAKSVTFLPQKEFQEKLKECQVAILQGGWGGIAEASSMGCRIVCVPRIEGIEHYHDQTQLVRALEKEGILTGCYDISELSGLVSEAKDRVFTKIKTGDASDVINSFIDRNL